LAREEIIYYKFSIAKELFKQGDDLSDFYSMM
jgi:hypothetical protein